MPPPLVWHSQGNCYNHPELTALLYAVDAPDIKRNKHICYGCPVQEECLQYAIKNDEQGIWAGTSERNRIRMHSQAVVREAHQACRQRNRRHEQEHLASVAPVSQEHISSQTYHTPLTLELISFHEQPEVNPLIYITFS